MKKYRTSVSLLVVLLFGSLMLQGCGAIAGIAQVFSQLMPAIGGILGNFNNIAGAVGNGLGAASNIARTVGSDRTADRLGQWSQGINQATDAPQDVQAALPRIQRGMDQMPSVARSRLDRFGNLEEKELNDLRTASREKLGSYNDRMQELSEKLKEEENSWFSSQKDIDAIKDEMAQVRERFDREAMNQERLQDEGDSRKNQKGNWFKGDWLNVREVKERGERTVKQIGELTDTVKSGSERLKNLEERRKEIADGIWTPWKSGDLKDIDDKLKEARDDLKDTADELSQLNEDRKKIEDLVGEIVTQ